MTAALVPPLAMAQAGAAPGAQDGVAAAVPAAPAAQSIRSDAAAVTAGESPVGNAERTAVRIETMALDMHLNADTGAVTTRARVEVRNGGASPLTRVALQVSSALLWQSARVEDAGSEGTRLLFQQFRVTTDTDHTGAANELVLALPKPLAPGAALKLDLYYGGTLLASAERLLRLGAPDVRAPQADWDGVSGSFVGLRGFGNVLWYPVSAPAALLADGDGFARAVSAEQERTAGTTMQLQLTLEHTGGSLATAWFLDRPVALVSPLRRLEAVASSPSSTQAADAAPASAADAVPEPAPDAAASAPDAVPEPASDVAQGDPEQSAIETAQWDAVRLDGRPVSLFVAGDARASAEATATPVCLRVVDDGASPQQSSAAVRQSYADAGEKVAPLLQHWLPARCAGALDVVTLPSPGTQAFADGGVLVAPVRASDTASLAESLVYPLAAAELPTDAPAWVREGVPEFLRLLYLEQTTGRDRMLAELGAIAPALQRAETSRGMDPLPLRSCVDPVCARSKAAFALVMLRGLVGDAALQQALHAMLLAPETDGGPDAAESGRAMTRRFEAALLQSSGKDLEWMFADWFRADRGLPDLRIVQVAPRRVERGAATVTEPTKRGPRLGPIGTEPQAEPDDPRRSSPTAASRNTVGLEDGSWLVAVEVQNDGDAAAEVPVTVRAAGLQNALPLRVPAHGRATVRVPFETAPEEVWVNDGTIPEQHEATHHRTIEMPQQAR